MSERTYFIPQMRSAKPTRSTSIGGYLMMSRLLAKSSGESLAEHTIWCLRAAQALLKSLALPEAESSTIEADVLMAVAIHDVGKAASGFQRVLRHEQDDWEGKRHEVLSSAFASSLQQVSDATLFAILTHHKTIPADGISDAEKGCLPYEQIYWADEIPSNVWQDMALEWRENEALFAQEWSKICMTLEQRVGAVGSLSEPALSPMRLVRDWLKRGWGKSSQRKAIAFRERYRASLVRGITIAADHLGSAHRIPPSSLPALRDFTILKGAARPFQEKTAGTLGSALLRAPTGSGKTEATLFWAQRNQVENGRLFYVLPHTASINAMYRRLGPGTQPNDQGIFGADNVGLLHSRATASLYDMLEATGDQCSQLDRQDNAKALAGLAREMWFPIRVCTPHQILRYMLRGRGWETMLGEFPGACFIFDEIHAYDARVVGLTLATAKLVSMWGGKSLFVLATLPEFMIALIRDALGDIPLIVPNLACVEDRAILQRKRHNVMIQNGNLLDEFERLADAVQRARSTLIVCNHVRTAQQLFARIQTAVEKDVCLLHSRFNQEDRNRIEQQISALEPPKVLVATQVVEVSLDLDFEQAFIEPAPIDALVQRMGRVNRSGRRDPATVVVYRDQVSAHRLYCNCKNSAHGDACRVRRSIQALSALKNPITESDLIDAANRVYDDGYQGDDRRIFGEGLNHPDLSQFEENLLAGAHQDWVEQVVESTDGRVEILPQPLVGEHKRRREKGLWIEANMLLVQVRLRTVRNRIDFSNDPWVLNCQYSPHLGLQY